MKSDSCRWRLSMSNHEIRHINNRSHISEVPESWELKRLKYLTKPKKDLSETGEEELLSVTETRGIIKRRDLKSADEPLSRSDDLIGYRLVEEGDLVNNIMLVWKRGLGVSPYSGIVSPAYSVFSFSKECDPWYFNYLLRSEEYVTEFRRNSTGITMSRLRLYDDSFGDVFGVLPPLTEQKLISRYLDKKTSQIDSLISKIEKKIELLKEQRTSLVNQYVTKGLDTNVEMKDSGVEWIGDIPKHWTPIPLRYLTADHRQGFYTSDPYDDDGVPILRISDINDDHTFSHQDSPRYSRPESEIQNFYVQTGDFLFPRTGGVGRFGIVDFDFPCIYGSFMIRFRWVDSVDRNFMKFFLESSLFTDQVKQEIHGGVNQNVHVENIKNVVCFQPPLAEQSRISEYISIHAGNLDRKIALVKKKIDLLKEYRQSIISSVVTGKIKVTEEMV